MVFCFLLFFFQLPSKMWPVQEQPVFETNLSTLRYAFLNGKRVIIKSCKDDSGADELRYHLHLACKQITMPLLGHVTTPDNKIAMIFEAGVSDLYRELGTHYHPWWRRMHFGMQVILCVATLHDCGFAHWDLNSKNCVVTSVTLEDGIDTRVKLIDLGLSRHYDSFANADETGRRGKIFSMHPDVFFRRPCNAFRADCYSLGILLFEILSVGNRLYDEPGDANFESLQQRGVRGVVLGRADLEEMCDILALDHFLHIVQDLLDGNLTARGAQKLWRVPLEPWDNYDGPCRQCAALPAVEHNHSHLLSKRKPTSVARTLFT